jgi:glucokinase
MAGIVLAVDAGGTTVRMGLFRCSEGRLELLQLTRRASAGWSDFERDFRGFLAQPEARAVLETAPARAAVFALAGPADTEGGRGSVTRWGPAVFREVAPLLDPLPFDHCILLNDIEASNHAVFHAAGESFRPLDGNATPPPRTRFIHLRPGTGLGVGVFSDGRSFPSEGGGAACAFDLSDPDELAVARHLRSTSGDALPPYEAALCGDGLRAMSEALTGNAVAPEVLTGDWGKSAVSGRVARLFVRLLARAAQGVALTLLPEACFFSGSIVDGFPDGAWGPLCGLFRNHPTQGAALSRVRLAIIQGPELILHGAALAGARALGLEVR